MGFSRVPKQRREKYREKYPIGSIIAILAGNTSYFGRIDSFSLKNVQIMEMALMATRSRRHMSETHKKRDIDYEKIIGPAE